MWTVEKGPAHLGSLMKGVDTMAISEARKKANQKWDAANLDRMSLAVPKGTKDAIKAHAAGTGESVNGFINRLIDGALSGDATVGPSDAAGAENEFNINLHPETIKAAQIAADAATEPIGEFIARAVTHEAERDKRALALRRMSEPIAAAAAEKEGVQE